MVLTYKLNFHIVINCCHENHTYFEKLLGPIQCSTKHICHGRHRCNLCSIFHSQIGVEKNYISRDNELMLLLSLIVRFIFFYESNFPSNIFLFSRFFVLHCHRKSGIIYRQGWDTEDVMFYSICINTHNMFWSQMYKQQLISRKKFELYFILPSELRLQS